ncbi:hypothetical protein [Neptuniibacter sp.]|uniref:hypothetical protein n=1 Tax=Neptuniibacter sp. TaxID=1962643 RepID=UPI00260A0B1A|nr:hypothetical protein [Neptuniibacter sp.]MCP4597068.1 hypothetical protein [Neptuniibacter sp.]
MADDISNLPDVDLGPIEADLKSAQDKGEGIAPKAEGDLGQFKTADALLEGYKNVQSFSTKVSQENKGLTEANEELQAKIDELEENQRMSYSTTQSTDTTPEDFSEAFYADPERAVTSKAMEAARLTRIEEVLEEIKLDSKNIKDFNEKYAWAKHAATLNPNLGSSAAGVKKLFEEGEKLKKQQVKEGSMQALGYLLGETPNDEQLAKLRELMGAGKTTETKTQNNNAYMPEVDSSTVAGRDVDRKPNTSATIAEAVEKGDADGVLDTMFGEIFRD